MTIEARLDSIMDKIELLSLLFLSPAQRDIEFHRALLVRERYRNAPYGGAVAAERLAFLSDLRDPAVSEAMADTIRAEVTVTPEQMAAALERARNPRIGIMVPSGVAGTGALTGVRLERYENGGSPNTGVYCITLFLSRSLCVEPHADGLRLEDGVEIRVAWATQDVGRYRPIMSGFSGDALTGEYRLEIWWETHEALLPRKTQLQVYPSFDDDVFVVPPVYEEYVTPVITNLEPSAEAQVVETV